MRANTFSIALGLLVSIGCGSSENHETPMPKSSAQSAVKEERVPNINGTWMIEHGSPLIQYLISHQGKDVTLTKRESGKVTYTVRGVFADGRLAFAEGSLVGSLTYEKGSTDSRLIGTVKEAAGNEQVWVLWKSDL